MRFPLHRVAWLVLAISIPAPGGAQDENDERARAHFSAASSYFSVGDYERALGEFDLAYQLSHRPALLYNISMCHERLGALANAVAYMERYLAEAETVPEREVMQERLANMRRRLADAAAEPVVEPVVQPGVEPGIEPAVEPVVEPASEPGEVLEPEVAENRFRGPVFASFIVGGAAAISLAVSGSLALSNSSCRPGCSDAEWNRQKRLNVLADVSLGLALAGLTLGTVLYLVG